LSILSSTRLIPEVAVGYFIVILLQTAVAARTISTFPGDRVSRVSFLQIHPPKYLDFHQGVGPRMVSPGAPYPQWRHCSHLMPVKMDLR